LLTASLNTKDLEKTQSTKEINEFLSKLLTPNKTHQFLESFYLLK